MVKAARGKQLDLDGALNSGVWGTERENISEAFTQLIDLLSTDVNSQKRTTVFVD
jgi:hypothetical protein